MYLVVNADDLGYAGRRDDGILRTLLHNEGITTSTSILVNGSSAEHVSERLLSMHGACVDVGLHVNLTEGVPVAERAEVSTLLDASGHFLGKMGFRAALQDGDVAMAQVRHEIFAQLAKFRRLLGYYPHHADGHQHVHVLADVCTVFAAALREHGVRWTRMPIEPAIGNGAAHWLSPGQRAFLSQVSSDADRCAHVYAERGVRFSRHFIGMTTMGADMSAERIVRGLEGLVHDARCTPELCGAHDDDDPHTAAVQHPDGTATCDQLPTSGNAPHSTATHPTPTSSHCPAEDHCSQRDNSSSSSLHASAGMASPTEGKENKREARNGHRPSAVHTCSVEVMVHPGHAVASNDGGCGQGPDDFAMSAERDHEVDVLCSTELRRRLEQLAVQFVSRRQLSEML